MKLGEVITKFRKQKNVSVPEMALAILLNTYELEGIEEGYIKPDYQVLRLIAIYLEVPITKLLFELFKPADFTEDQYDQLFEEAKPQIEKLIEILIEKSEVSTSDN
jgi:transcriptional regulator with XRE-family HTH domain